MTESSFVEREFTPFNDNAFGLVYEGALTENADGAVNIDAIRYPYRDFTAVANVYTPAGYESAKSYPAVVVAHPNGGVKEQVAGNYAQKLAEAGYIALAFDAAYDLYREGYYYYGRDCAHPGSTFSYTVSSLMELAAWDAREGAQLIDVPLLMMMGSHADTGYMTIDCFERAVNAPVRELFEIPGATHIQTYWKPEYVSQAAGKLVEFFGKHV